MLIAIYNRILVGYLTIIPAVDLLVPSHASDFCRTPVGRAVIAAACQSSKVCVLHLPSSY